MTKYTKGKCIYCEEYKAVECNSVCRNCNLKKQSAHEFYIEAQKIREKIGLDFDKKALRK